MELHLDQKDWHAHGHGTDPPYNGVILHGVLGSEADNTILQNGNAVPVVSLASMVESPSTALGSGQPSYLWGLLSAHGYDQPGDLADLSSLLDRAGDDWFRRVSDTFGIFLQAGEDPQQIPYSAIMEALGYRQNRQPFLDLAYRVPYRRLEAMVGSLPSKGRTLGIAEILLKVLGYSSDDEGSSPRGLESRSRSRLGWNSFRVRPPNHSRNRILGISRLVDRYLPSDSVPTESMEGKGLILGFSQLIESLPEGGADKNCCLLIDALNVKAGSEKSSVTQGCIGKGRAGDMGVNAVLPFFHALAIHTGNAALADRCGRMFRSFPKLPPNGITREMEEQLCRLLI